MGLQLYRDHLIAQTGLSEPGLHCFAVLIAAFSRLYASVGRYHGTTVEPRTVVPRYFFFTVPVPSRSRYYRGTAIPQIPRYYRTVPADK